MYDNHTENTWQHARPRCHTLEDLEAAVRMTTTGSAYLYNHPVTTKESTALTKFIRAWIADRKLSALGLAKRAGIPHTTLSALFNHGNVPRPVTLKKLATAMGMPVGQLLVLAGHITQQEYEQPVGDIDLARLYEVGDLDGDEWQQVLDFARYVRSKRNTR